MKYDSTALRLIVQAVVFVLLLESTTPSNQQNLPEEPPNALIHGAVRISGDVAIDDPSGARTWFSSTSSFKSAALRLGHSPSFVDQLAADLQEAQDSVKSPNESVEGHVYLDVITSSALPSSTSRFLFIAKSDKGQEFRWLVLDTKLEESLNGMNLSTKLPNCPPECGDEPCRKISTRCYICPKNRVICLGQRLTEIDDIKKLLHVE